MYLNDIKFDEVCNPEKPNMTSVVNETLCNLKDIENIIDVIASKITGCPIHDEESVPPNAKLVGLASASDIIHTNCTTILAKLSEINNIL